MPTTRADVIDRLSIADPSELQAILSAAGVSARGAETSDALARRIADALWWNYTTPLGYALDRGSLEDITQYLARRVGVRGLEGDAFEMLAELTAALAVAGPVSWSDLDEATRRRIFPPWMPSVVLGAGATTSAGARYVSRAVLGATGGWVGRILPLLPTVGPWFKMIRTSAGVVSVVSGPLAVALGVLSVNQALGTNERRLLPLALGVGALTPPVMTDAVEVTVPA